MTEFTALDLARIPFPETVQSLDFETVLAQLKLDMIAAMPELADVLNLETEPLVVLLERFAAEKVNLLAQLNDEARKNSLAHAFGDSLDNFGAFVGVVRAVLDEGDSAALPPVAPTYETDQTLRVRTQLAMEGKTSAGPAGSYVFHGLASSPDVKDISAIRGIPGEAIVRVLSIHDFGQADQLLLDTVYDYLDDKRPLCTDLTVLSAEVTEYQVSASLMFLPTANTDAITAAARLSCQDYVTRQHRLGHDITRAGLFHALWQEGMQNIDITAPVADIVQADHQAAFCTEIILNNGGIDV